MAFVAMESIRNAEQEAQLRLQQAEISSQQAVEQAKLTFESIISDAESDAKVLLDHSAEKASAKAEEIIVTERNNALLEADKLKAECAKLQDAVNKAVLELIV